ncbi:hypothetical protein AB0C34_23220 [Nocardia sp. NPDC049220]|uniref:hypothetical protein n=1 Tax=Nocardia sp. NPDC049220 TaxID=3155273 RepID=UPI0033C646B4
MSRANKNKTARRRARGYRRGADDDVARREAEFVTAMQTEIWHRRYPPASVMQALGTPCGHPVPAPDLRVFTGLDIMLRVRGWTFVGACSGPEVLTFSYGPSDAGPEYLQRGLEPITTIAATLDRSLPTDTAADCEVEVLLVGVPSGQGLLTGLAGLTPHLGVIETHTPGDRIPVPFPIGRARVAGRVNSAIAGR